MCRSQRATPKDPTGAKMTARATSLDEFKASLTGMVHVEEIAQALAFKPRPTDVIIAPFGKCGSTWLQQIFHTLRTGGSEDFDDISRVVPWIETSAALGIALDAEHVANPRGYKSHLSRELVPKGCRYIVSLRDPCDALVSAYHFMTGWLIEPGAVGIDDFALGHFGPQAEDPFRQSYWHHLVSWWNVRAQPEVLVLSYEDMLRRPEQNVRRVAEHCQIPLGDDLLALTMDRASLGYMKAHQDKFDDALMRGLSESRLGLPPGSDSSKVREGKSGTHKHELSGAVIEAMDAKWRELVEPELGFANYSVLEAALASELAATD